MPAKNPTLHGNAPDKAAAAILLIDVINDLEFPEGDRLLDYAVPMARAIAALKQRAKDARVPVVYVNDNFGRWQSNFTSQVEHCLQDGVRGRRVVELSPRMSLQNIYHLSSRMLDHEPSLYYQPDIRTVGIKIDGVPTHTALERRRQPSQAPQSARGKRTG